MTEPSNNNPPTIENLAENQQRIIETVAGLVDVVTELVDGVAVLADGQRQMNGRLDDTNKRLDGHNRRLDETNKRLDGANKRLDDHNRRLDDTNKRLDDHNRRLDDTNKRLDGANKRLDDHNRRLDETNKRLDGANKRLDDHNRRLDDTNKRLDGTNEKLDGLMDDISLVKGGHARNETIRNASLIAHRLGYQFISEMRQEALIGFAELAKGNGVAVNEAESFAKADLVMIVQDANNQPGYIAVEVSFTVDDNDVRRAVRNADYLHKYTGIRAHAAVAGVDILPDVKRQVDAGKVHWYEIPRREIQPA